MFLFDNLLEIRNCKMYNPNKYYRTKKKLFKINETLNPVTKYNRIRKKMRTLLHSQKQIKYSKHDKPIISY